MSLDTDIYDHADDCDCAPCHIESVKSGDVDKCGCQLCQEQAETDYELAHEE